MIYLPWASRLLRLAQYFPALWAFSWASQSQVPHPTLVFLITVTAYLKPAVQANFSYCSRGLI